VILNNLIIILQLEHKKMITCKFLNEHALDVVWLKATFIDLIFKYCSNKKNTNVCIDIN